LRVLLPLVSQVLPTQILLMRISLFCLLLALVPVSTHAAIIRLEMRPGIDASAEYLAGQRNKPAALLLHGFLQTREFPTVDTLARGLQDAGYPVLTPTLSLDIPSRAQSLACEAVHQHSLDEDVAEIARWVSWLKSRGHRSHLGRHSFGSMQLLAYLAARPDAAVKGYIVCLTDRTQIARLRVQRSSPLESRAQRRSATWSTQQCLIAENTARPGSLVVVRALGSGATLRL